MRDVGDKIGFQFGQRQLARDISVHEQDACTHQQRECSQDQELLASKTAAQIRNRGPVESDAQNQPVKNAVKGTLHFGLPSVPASRSRERRLLLCGSNHDGRLRVGWIAMLITGQRIVQSLGEEGTLKVVGIKDNPSKRGMLRSRTLRDEE